MLFAHRAKTACTTRPFICPHFYFCVNSVGKLRPQKMERNLTIYVVGLGYIITSSKMTWLKSIEAASINAYFTESNCVVQMFIET